MKAANEDRVWAEIDLAAISDNLAVIRSRLPRGVGVMAVLKADAYGHGAVPVAWQVVRDGISAIGVGNSREALELRQAGIDVPILILGAVVPGELDGVVAHEISTSIHSAERVRRLSREASRQGRIASVHLNIDTGMGRLGVTPGRALDLIRLIHESRHLRLDGIYSHFSSIHLGEVAFTMCQLSLFDEILDQIRSAGVPPAPTHVASSAAIFEGIGLTKSLVRPGIALYGIHPCSSGRSAGLRPALSLRTQVIFLKDVPAGTPIGYGRCYVTPTPTRIAVIPVGYKDGIPYRLSNRGRVLVRARSAPVVGAISMDYTTVDVGHIPGVETGDAVTLIGTDGDEEITVWELATRAGTIPYEILTALDARVRRRYLRTTRSDAGRLHRHVPPREAQSAL